jgi:hypothetical protein
MTLDPLRLLMSDPIVWLAATLAELRSMPPAAVDTCAGRERCRMEACAEELGEIILKRLDRGWNGLH